MESSIFDDVTPHDKNAGSKLLESHQYWHTKRLLFNIIVGIAGIIAIALFSRFRLFLFDIFGIVAWGVVANIFYSTGYVLESSIIVWSKGGKNLKNSRNVLFWIGTLAYALVSYVFCGQYFI